MSVRALCTAALLCALPLTAQADLNLPVSGTVTSGVGWRLDPFGSGKNFFHRGIDIAVPAGTPVRATRGGRVTFAGPHGGYGSTVILKHENGASTLYGHNSILTVAVGGQVQAGEIVAYSGNSGHSTGPHVHYEVIGGDAPVAMAKVEEKVDEKLVAGHALRESQELRMDETMTSILNKIRDTLPGGRGGE